MVNADMWDANYRMAPEVIADTLAGQIDLSRSTVLDFGCGIGIKTLGFAQHFRPRRAIGVDLRPEYDALPDAAAQLAGLNTLPDNLSFLTIKPGQPLADLIRPDCIFSWSVFEHVRRDLIPAILLDHHAALTTDGLMFIQINPLYFSPFGHHLGSLLDEPWVHLTLSEADLERRLFATRLRTHRTGIKQMLSSKAPLNDKVKENLWACYRSLNRLTLPELLDMAETAGFFLINKTLGTTGLTPPRQLRKQYAKDALETEGIRLLFGKVR